MKSTLILMVLLISLGFRPAIAQHSGIQFYDGTFNDLKAKAAAEKKIIFIDAFTTWCGPCKWMAKNVFTDLDVANFYNQNFVNAKIDMEKGEGIELAKAYNVQAYPSLLYLDAEGKVVHRTVGAIKGKEFIKLGMDAQNPDRNLMGLDKKFNSDPGAYPTAYAYISLLNEISSPDKKIAFDSYFATQDKSTWIESNNWRMLYDFVKNPENPVFVYFKENRSRFSEKYTVDSVDAKLKEVYFGLVQQAAYDQNNEQWESGKKAISELGIKGGDRFIASTTIVQAGDDPVLANQRIVEFMTKFGSENPDELNEYAWRVFESSSEKSQLNLAESWAKKGLGLAPSNWMVTDTYANLLFKNGKKAEAETQAQKAIKLGKKEGADVKGTEELLKKIKKSSVSAAKLKTKK